MKYLLTSSTKTKIHLCLKLKILYAHHCCNTNRHGKTPNLLKYEVNFFCSKFLFKFKLVDIQYDIGFRRRTQWFITYIQHPVFNPTGTILKAHHPFRPFPHPPTPCHLPSSNPNFVLYTKVSYSFLPSLFLPSFIFSSLPQVHLFGFLNSTYE